AGKKFLSAADSSCCALKRWKHISNRGGSGKTATRSGIAITFSARYHFDRSIARKSDESRKAVEFSPRTSRKTGVLDNYFFSSAYSVSSVVNSYLAISIRLRPCDFAV